jgi:photosystem II PsbZ protein
MLIIFQLLLSALVLFSFVMLIGVPVAYASGFEWGVSKKLIFLGSIIWGGLVVAVGALNFLVA